MKEGYTVENRGVDFSYCKVIYVYNWNGANEVDNVRWNDYLMQIALDKVVAIFKLKKIKQCQ